MAGELPPLELELLASVADVATQFESVISRVTEFADSVVSSGAEASRGFDDVATSAGASMASVRESLAGADGSLATLRENAATLEAALSGADTALEGTGAAAAVMSEKVALAAAKLSEARTIQAARAKEVADAEAALKDMQERGVASADALKAAQDRVSLAMAREARAAAETRGAMGELKAVDGEADVAASGFGRFRGNVTRGISGMGGKIAGFAKQVGALGGLFAGIEVAKFAGESLKGAQELQKGVQVVINASGESQKNFAKLQQGVLNISSKTGTALDQTTEGLYTVEKAGFRGSKALSVLKAAAMGASDEGADLGTVSSALTTVMQDQQGKTLTAAQAMNALLVASGNSKSTLQLFADSLGRVLPVGEKLGLTFPQITAGLGTMAASGLSAKLAAQDLNHAMISLANPTANQAREMQVYGLNANRVAKELSKKGLSGTINELSGAVMSKMSAATKANIAIFGRLSPAAKNVAKGFANGTMTLKQFTSASAKLPAKQQAALKKWAPSAQNYIQAMAKMTGGNTGLAAAMMLSGKASGDLRKRTADIGHAMKSTSELTDKFKKTNQTAGQSMKVMKQTISNAGVELAEKLLPYIAKASLGITKFVNNAMKFGHDNASWIKPTVKYLALALAGFVALKVVIRIGRSIKDAYDGVKSAVLGVRAAARGIKAGISGGMSALRSGAGKAKDAMVALKNSTIAQTIASKAQAAASKVAAAAQWLWDAAMDANPITIVVIAVIALIAIIVLLAIKFKSVRQVLENIWHAIKSAFTAAISFIVNFVKSHWLLLVAIIGGPIALAVGLVIKYWGKIKHAFSAAVSFVVNFVKSHWRLLLSIVGGPIVAIVLLVQKNWGKIKQIFSAAVKAVISTVKGWVSDVEKLAKSLWKSAVSTFNHLKSDLENIAADIHKAIVNAWNKLVSTVEGIVKDFINREVNGFRNLKNDLSNIVGDIKSAVENGFRNAVSAVEHILSGFVSAGRRYFDRFLSAVKSSIGKVKSSIESGIRNALSWLKSFASNFASVGKAIVDGIVSGIKNAGGAILGTLKGIAGGALSGVKHFFHIGSPSRVFADEVGQWIPKGIAVGIDEHAQSVITAATNVGKAAVEGARVGLTNARSVLAASSAGITRGATASLYAGAVGANSGATGVLQVTVQTTQNLDGREIFRNQQVYAARWAKSNGKQAFQFNNNITGISR